MTLLVAGLAVAEKWSRQWSDNQSTELGAGAFEDDTGPKKHFHKAPSPGSARASCWPGRAPDIGPNPRPQSWDEVRPRMNRARGSESRRPRTLDPPEPECSSEAYALFWVLFKVFRARAPNMAHMLSVEASPRTSRSCCHQSVRLHVPQAGPGPDPGPESIPTPHKEHPKTKGSPTKPNRTSTGIFLLNHCIMKAGISNLSAHVRACASKPTDTTIIRL